MKNSMTLDQMKLELIVDKDVRTFIEALQDCYDAGLEDGSLSNKEISSSTGMDPSAISRLMNGRSSNPNIRTVLKVFRAMGKRVSPCVEDLVSLEACKSNWRPDHGYDRAVRHIEIFSSVAHTRASYRSRLECDEAVVEERNSMRVDVTYRNSLTSMQETS